MKAKQTGSTTPKPDAESGATSAVPWPFPSQLIPASALPTPTYEDMTTELGEPQW